MMLEHWAAVLAAGGILGLLVGSFLNVVVYRLPIIMDRQWRCDCAALLGQAEGSEAEKKAQPAFNLMYPRSACPKCQHQIKWYENIPVFSYLALRGRCAGCGVAIGIRYPLVELATGGLFAFCAWRWGLTWATAAWCFFSAVILASALIDWDTTLLPDSLTLPLMWAGLIGSALGITSVPIHASLWGAVAGYMSLWLVYWIFKLATGKEGMGYGDFKLFAALGAWFGATALIPIIFMASAIGAVVGLGMKLRKSLREGRYVPFGPFLAGAGLTAMFVSPQHMLRMIYGMLGM